MLLAEEAGRPATALRWKRKGGADG